MNNRDRSIVTRTATSNRCYTVLGTHRRTSFGFGSGAPSRIDQRIEDTPGPGSYDPHETSQFSGSIRGYGTGFTSYEVVRTGYDPEDFYIKLSKRKIWHPDKNPAPKYLPPIVDHRIKIKLPEKTKKNVRSYNPFVEEVPVKRPVKFKVPGPGTYEIPKPLPQRGPSAVFKSRSKRDSFTTGQKIPSVFDGRNIYV